MQDDVTRRRSRLLLDVTAAAGESAASSTKPATSTSPSSPASAKAATR